MKSFLSKIVFYFLVVTICVMPLFNVGHSLVQAAGLNNETILVENDAFLRSEIKRLNAELASLEKQLPEKTKLETPLEERRAYVQSIVDVLAQIEALELKLKEHVNGENLADGELGKGKDRVLILTDILYKGKPHNQAGYIYENCSSAGCAERSDTYTTRVEEYPSVIRPGEAFDIMASKTVRFIKAENLGTASSNASVRIDIAVNSTRSDAIKMMGDKLGSGAFIKDAYDVSDRVSLRMSFEPLPLEPTTKNGQGLEGAKTGFKFSSERLEGNHVNNAPSRVGQAFYFVIPAKGEKPSGNYVIRVEVGELSLLYKWGKESDTPVIAEQIPEDGVTTDSIANESDKTNTVDGNGVNTDQNSNQDNLNTENGAADPRIQQLITTWINNAEPPDNARIGASLKYEKWGRVYGQTPTGLITVNAAPDYAGTYPSHFNYLWEVRTKLDSVDHCTLDEFITIGLENGSLTICEGRYKPVVPNLLGMPAQEAVTLLAHRKLTTILKSEGPAPDASKSMTVVNQSIAEGESLNKQSSVELSVYSPYIERKTVPDVTGLLFTDAKKMLEDQGFTAHVILGSKPEHAQESKRIESQTPEAGVVIKPGSTISLKVHPEYIALVTVPSLENMTSAEATAKLESLGLKATEDKGPEAPRQDLSERVMAQSISPDVQVKQGTEIHFKTFSKYSPPMYVPNLIGLTQPEAINKLISASQISHFSPGQGTTNPQLVGRVYQQTVPAGSVARKGGVVIAYVYQDADAIRRRQQAIAYLEGRTDTPPAAPQQPSTQPRGEYGGLTVNQSRAQMSAGEPRATYSPAPASSSASTASSGYCGRGFTGAQTQSSSGLTPYSGSLSGGYTLRVSEPGETKMQGLTGAGAEIWKGNQKYFNVSFFWVENPTSQALSVYQMGLKNAKSNENGNQENNQNRFRNYTFESPTRYLSVTTFQPSSHYGAPMLNKQKVGSIICGLLSKMEPQGAPKNAVSSTPQKTSTSSVHATTSNKDATGDCGLGYTGAQKTGFSSDVLVGLNFGGYNISFVNGAKYLKPGYSYSSAVYPKNPVTGSYLPVISFNIGFDSASDQKWIQTSGFKIGHGSFPTFYLESPTRHVFVNYSDSNMEKAKGMACVLLKALEPYASSKQSNIRYTQKIVPVTAPISLPASSSPITSPSGSRLYGF